MFKINYKDINFEHNSGVTVFTYEQVNAGLVFKVV